MTITELVKQSGLKLRKHQISALGNVIYKKAKEKEIEHKKVPETIYVNDYPESFIQEMQQTLIEWVSAKK